MKYQQNAGYFYYPDNIEFVFFDDQIQNLKMAYLFHWKTILIHHKFIKYMNYEYINHVYPNIYQAILSYNLGLIE